MTEDEERVYISSLPPQRGFFAAVCGTGPAEDFCLIKVQ
jgi:hypothetical protein